MYAYLKRIAGWSDQKMEHHDYGWFATTRLHGVQLTSAELKLISDLLKDYDSVLVEEINEQKPKVQSFWEAADVEKKDQMEVRYAFDLLNQTRDFLRGMRWERSVVASINKKLKNYKKATQF